MKASSMDRWVKPGGDGKRIFRFAPSPNGYLHLGHAFSALLNAKMVRAVQGRLLLRIEDIDATRCRPAFEAAIYEDLAWLGITWEQPVRRQSEHFDDYRMALNRLEAMGLVYPSFESRAEIAAQVADRETQGPWPRDPDGVPLYPGVAKYMPEAERARHINAGEPYALRLDMQATLARISSFTSPLVGEVARRSDSVGERVGGDIEMQQDKATPPPIPPPQGGREEFVARTSSLAWLETGAGPNSETGLIAADPAAWGDVILARKEVPTSYHLAVVVDDAAQGVTDVLRGRDLFHATSVHRLLQTLLGLPAPRYHHHRLVLDAEGNKLSKSTSATGLRELRALGVTPNEIRRLVGLNYP